MPVRGARFDRPLWLTRAAMSTGAPKVHVLDADPDLLEGLDPDEAALARRHAVAAVRRLDAGRWDAEAEFGAHRGMLGLLVLDGLLTREVTLGAEASVELLGAGDLLRPWDHDGGYGIPSVDAFFTVLEPVSLAILDEPFVAAVARWPSVTAAIVGRSGRRARWLAVRIGISQLHRVDARLLFLFWHLAERWGRATPEGIVLPLALTHERLGQLIGAQRQTVTTALGTLERRGLVIRRGGGSWLLHGETPEALGRLLQV